MKKFEAACMQTVKSLEANKKCMAAVSTASEIIIDIYGSIEFMEAAETVGYLQKII